MSTLLENCKRLSEHTLSKGTYHDDMDLKDRVREARLSAGIRSQSELARRCGCDSTAINKLERGGILALSGDLLLKIAAETGVSPEWLSSGIGSRSTTVAEQISYVSDPVLDQLAALGPEKERAWREKIAQDFAEMESGNHAIPEDQRKGVARERVEDGRKQGGKHFHRVTK